MKEFWTDIRTEKGKYQVSSKGRVRSLDRWVDRKPSRIFRKGQILVPYPCKNGYLRVHLSGRKSASVHRLVAMAFVPNPHRYTEINHKDSNRQNNNCFNIEWCSRVYNCTRPHKLKLVSICNCCKGKQKTAGNYIWQSNPI